MNDCLLKKLKQINFVHNLVQKLEIKTYINL